MKKFYTLLLSITLCSASTALATEGITTLDLSANGYTFDSNGTWSELYNGTTASELAADSFDSQIFRMSHMGYAEYGGYFEGFAPCTNTDMTDKASYSVGCMAGGGIEIDANGNVVTDENGNVNVDASMPYLVGYYSTYYSYPSSCQIQFTDGAAHELVGMYVTNFPTSFYNCVYGNGYARAFVNGDKFTLTVHGVAADQSEQTIDIDLIKYEDGMLQAVRGWKYIDLSSLGAVEMIYFTMSSTDSGTWGMNTSAYFCIDKLMVKSESSSVANLSMANGITYDRKAKEIVLPQSEFAIIYNANGQKVMASEGQRFSVANLDNGIYVVKTANATLKFVK